MVHGMFSIHGEGEQPLTCGDFDMTPDQGIQFVEAFIYAINNINAEFAPNHGLLRGVSLGALGYDDCMSPVLSNQIITEVQRYAYRVTDENGQNMLDAKSVEAYLGGSNDELAVGMAAQMNQLRKPVMIYQAYTEALDKDDMYHYYVRNHYSARVVARTIVLALIRNGWKYVQSVYDENVYGAEFNDIFRRVAAEEGICVVASHQIDGSGAHVVDQLRGRPNVRPVIILTGYRGFRKFMQGVKDRAAAGEFQYISTIGDSKKAVEGFELESHGMLSIRLWAPSTAYTGLREQLRGIDVMNYKTNPWFREWYEKLYDCSFDPSSTKNQCTAQSLNLGDIEFNEKVVTVIYGMRAFAHALDRTLRHYCGYGM